MSLERIVLGTAGVAGPYYTANGHVTWGRPVDESAAYAVFESAWRAGVREVDLGTSYGDGSAVGRLSRWCQSSGKHFRVTAKIGRPLENGIIVPKTRIEELAKEVTILQRAVSPITRLLLKDPPSFFFESARTQALLFRLADRFPNCEVGIASHRLWDCTNLLPTNTTRVAEIEYNGLNWWIASRVASNLKKKGWTVWAMQPLAHGFLASADGIANQKSVRAVLLSSCQKAMSAGATAFFYNFRNFDRYSLAQIAIAFCLSDSCVDRVVVGPKTSGHVDDTIVALDLSSSEEFKNVVSQMRESVVGASKGSPARK